MIDPDKLKCGQREAKLKSKPLFLIKTLKEFVKNGQMIFLINCVFQTTFILFWASQTA